MTGTVHCIFFWFVTLRSYPSLRMNGIDTAIPGMAHHLLGKSVLERPWR